jgi:hypothetical protein
MTTPWKIFACVLVVAVIAAIMMGNASHAHRTPAAVAVGETTTEFPKGPTGPLSAPPVDKVPPPSTSNAPQSLTSMPAPSSTAPAATSSSGSSSGSSSSTSTEPSATPSGLPHYGVAETPSETPSSGSDTEVSQSQAPVETASQRVGRRLRGH